MCINQTAVFVIDAPNISGVSPRVLTLYTQCLTRRNTPTNARTYIGLVRYIDTIIEHIQKNKIYPGNKLHPKIPKTN